MESLARASIRTDDSPEGKVFAIVPQEKSVDKMKKDELAIEVKELRHFKEHAMGALARAEQREAILVGEVRELREFAAKVRSLLPDFVHLMVNRFTPQEQATDGNESADRP